MHDEDHAHHGERSNRPAPQGAMGGLLWRSNCSHWSMPWESSCCRIACGMLTRRRWPCPTGQRQDTPGLPLGTCHGSLREHEGGGLRLLREPRWRARSDRPQPRRWTTASSVGQHSSALPLTGNCPHAWARSFGPISMTCSGSCRHSRTAASPNCFRTPELQIGCQRGFHCRARRPRKCIEVYRDRETAPDVRINMAPPDSRTITPLFSSAATPL